jgi:transposase
MRRTHLRKHNNILKRLLIHVAGADLGLLLSNLYGIGTPRGLQWLSLTFNFFFVLIASELEFKKNGGQMDRE